MGITSRLKRHFTSGLLIILPLMVSLLIIRFMASYVFMFVDPIVQSTNLAQYTGNIRIVAQSITVFIVIVTITGLGYFSKYSRTQGIRRRIMSLIDHIPIFGPVYSTVNQISSSFRGENSKFKEIVLVEYPREGLYSIGLITSETPDDIDDKAEEEDMKAVYMPNSPNPTMGRLVMVPEEDYTKLDMSIQEGMKFLVTTGIGQDEDELPEKIQVSTEQEE